MTRPGMQREACRICGRTGSNDPAQTCNQVRGIDDEYECRGDGPWSEDEDGFFLYPTPEALEAWHARLDRAILEEQGNDQ